MSTSRKILIFETSYTLTNYLLKYWAEIVSQAIAERERFTAVLSGGRTPVEFYCKLSGIKNFDQWRKTHIFLTDERFVSWDEEESNYGMIKNNLLNYVDIPLSHGHPVDTSLENAAVSAKAYESELKQFFSLQDGMVPVFDLMFLGLGEDGHTASLFPEGKEVNEAKRLVVDASIAKLKHSRISLTLPVINNARHIIVLVCGRQKARIFKELIAQDSHLPAARIKPAQGELTYVLDKDAASEISFGDDFTHQGEAIAMML